jgi:hypothetical protein
MDAASAGFTGDFAVNVGNMRIRLPSSSEDPRLSGLRQFRNGSLLMWTPENGEPQLVWQNEQNQLFTMSFEPLKESPPSKAVKPKPRARTAKAQ